MARETETSTGVRTITDDNPADLATSFSLPVGFRMSSTAQRFELELLPRDFRTWLLLAFALLGNVLAVAGWVLAFRTGKIDPNQMFNYVFVNIWAIGTGYPAIVLTFCRLRIAVEAGVLTIKRIPFGFGAREVRAADIAQVTLQRGIRYSVNEQPVYGHDVCIRLRGGQTLSQVQGGQSITLITGLPSFEMASEIERRLEQHLGIDDDGKSVTS